MSASMPFTFPVSKIVEGPEKIIGLSVPSDDIHPQKVRSNQTSRKGLDKGVNTNSSATTQRQLKRKVDAGISDNLVLSKKSKSNQPIPKRPEQRLSKDSCNIIDLRGEETSNDESPVGPERSIDIASCDDLDLHQQEAESEDEDPIQAHQEITAKPLMVDVIPSTMGSSTFSIHQDLLTVHAPVLAQSMQSCTQSTGSRTRLDLPAWIDAQDFSVLASWLHTGILPQISAVPLSPRFLHRRLATLWMLGYRMCIPSFQNAVMDCLRNLCADSQTEAASCPWPSILESEDIYQHTEPRTEIRLFTAAALSIRRPVDKMDKDSEAGRKCFGVWNRCPDLFADLCESSWEGKTPWSDESRHLWMVEDDMSLQERWDELVVKRRKLTKAKITGWGGGVLAELYTVL